MSNLTPAQRVAVLTAISKAVDTEIKKARSEADEDMHELYKVFGSDRMKVELNGVEIGTLSLTFSEDAYEVTDQGSFEDFCVANGLAHVKREISPEFMAEALRRIAEETPGAIVETVVMEKDADKYLKRMGDVMMVEGTSEVVPGIAPKPVAAKGTRLTGCKPEVVLPALRSLPGGVEALLLGGGADE